ncbi:DUF1499 domain-containing protein [Bosea sp. (in: a-proteobacteria)]|uniref:DUF1499 domain-containing protein n=1 Tax=Bosea sp. (in: a-proteobacteria) TaxID=1871050 RepID=UPI00260BDF56|nr:DUF1499 domain-containing protein [Bosea sp. (in: a-proteobacteria)]MCO5090705.1 DUF1499 domain-containing protein [Bosea sp. (in: a-proteobacteria)]
MHRRLVFTEPVSRAAVWSRRLAWFSCAVLMLSLLLVRLGEPSIEGLAPVAGAYVLVLAALGLAILAFVRIWHSGHRGVGMAAGALTLSLVLLVPAGFVAFRLATRPALTDVSTDIDDPPAFSRSQAALTARAGRVPPDPPPESRRLQRRAYPKAVPILLEVPAEAAFDLARRAARGLGWQVLETVRPGGRSGTGRVEAIARGRILRFSEDITIRVRPRVDGSRIDIRSASRLGSHDLGANAARIAAFADEIELLMDSR